MLAATLGCEAVPLEPSELSSITSERQSERISAEGDPTTRVTNILVVPIHSTSEILVAVDGLQPGYGADGTADQVYRLQGVDSEEMVALGFPGSVQLSDAVIAYESTSLAIRHPRLSLVLSINDAVSDSGNRAYSAAATHIAGYGLSRNTGSWPMEAAELALAARQGFVCGESGGAFELASYSGDLIDDDEVVCASGGEGASQCGIGVAGMECTITCRDGYYACCNVLGGCQCVKEEEDPEE